MNLSIQPTEATAPTIINRDFPLADNRPAFSIAEIQFGADTFTIFLPFGGRISYNNKDTK